MQRSRNWCLTRNNYHDDDIVGVEGALYTILGKEVGEEGTPHLQGFVHFENARTFNGVKLLLPTCHIEAMRGTIDQAVAYCKKDNDWVEFGDKPLSAKEKGEQNAARWANIIELAEAGDWEKLKTDYPVEYGTRLSCLEHIHRKRPREIEIIDGDLEHVWVWGDTGLGKTRTALAENPGAYLKDPKERWWDGYDGEEVVIVDDFDKYQVSQGGDMKRWADRYPFMAPVKGGYLKIRPRKIYVTSQYSPEQIWDDPLTVEAINRRFHVIHLLSGTMRSQVSERRVGLGDLSRGYGNHGRVTHAGYSL